MYKSPIEMLCSEIQRHIDQENENMVITAIRNVGVNIDKDELMKALRYDRNQYAKGYEDGKNEILNKIRNGEIEVWNGMNGQVVMPKGTFEKIYNECKEEDDDI